MTTQPAVWNRGAAGPPRTPVLASLVFTALIFLPLVITLHTLVYFFGLSPAGDGSTGCWLEEYCHYSSTDIVQSQLPGIIYVALPLSALAVALVARREQVRILLVAMLVGAARFFLPLGIWLLGTRLEGPVPAQAALSYCADESLCHFQAGLTYYFVTPLEAASGLVSFMLYAATFTIWIHVLGGPGDGRS